MALQSSGPISMSDIMQELGVFSGAFSLNAAELGQFGPINQFSTVKPDGSKTYTFINRRNKRII